MYSYLYFLPHLAEGSANLVEDQAVEPWHVVKDGEHKSTARPLVLGGQGQLWEHIKLIYTSTVCHTLKFKM
jgi:hypothetical protein